MVKIRVTVTVLPEEIYLAAQDGHLPSAARSTQARKFMVPCESPETWTIGQFANKIKDAYSRTYRGEDLGTIKYIKDEDDADLHTDLSVYDALVNAGDEAMNIRDQRTKITVIQEQGLPLRGGSVLPDLLAPQYQIPRPPPPPLFSDSPQARSGTRKRSSDAAFGGEASSTHWARIPPNQRPRPVMASVDPGEYSLVASVEYDTLEETDQTLRHRGEASVDLTQDEQLPSVRRVTNFESPDPQVPLQHFKPASRVSVEVFDTATNTSPNLLEAAPSPRSNEQGDVLRESYDDRTQKQISRGYASVPDETKSPASQKAVPLAAPSAADELRASPTANPRLHNQAQTETSHHRPHPPITPPADVSPADLRRRLAQPAPKSLGSSAGATRASYKFKPPVPRPDVFVPHSSIEDSQMSPRSKEKSKPDVDTEAALRDQTRHGSRTVSKAGKAKAPISEMAELHHRKSPIISGNRPRNEPVHAFSETSAFLGDGDDHELQTCQDTIGDELEATVACHGLIDDELSTDQSLADSQDKNENRSKTSSSPRYHHSLPSRSDYKPASSSRESSGSADQTDGDSNKENRPTGRSVKSSDMEMHEQILDTDMEDASSEEGVGLSTSNSLRPNERFQDTELSAKTVELPTNLKDKSQTTIDILNGGGLMGDTLGDVGDFGESRQSLGTSARRSAELKENVSIPITRQRRKTKSRKEGSASQPVPGVRLRDSDLERNEPDTHAANDRQAVPGESRHGPGKIKARPDPETPTSMGSAGDQLQQSLQASTQEPTHTTEEAPFSVSDPGFSIPFPIQFNGRLVLNKVYQGVVKEIKGTSAVIELQGVKGNPCGLLHKNGAAIKTFKGPISRILALGQVVKVKVTQRMVAKGSDTIAKLSMLNIDQVTGEFVQPSLVDNKKKFLKPAEDRRNIPSDPQVRKGAGDGKDGPNVQVQAEINRANKADIKHRPVTSLQESHGEARDDSAGTNTNVNNGGDVEVMHVTDRAETPANQGPREPHFGLGSTNTPRKSQERAASLGEPESSMIPSAIPGASGREQPLIEIRDGSLPNAGSSTFEEAVDESASQNRAPRKVSAPQSKNNATKARSKTKLREKQSKSRDSMEMVVADTEQDNNHPQDENNVSRKKLNISLGQNVQLPEKPTETGKMEVTSEEYIAFPPTMTREQFLALRQANAAAIARRNAAAIHKSDVAKPSGPAKAQPVRQSSTANVKKPKENADSHSPLAAAFETAPDKKTSKNKQHTTGHRSSSAGADGQTDTQKQSRSQLDSIIGEQSKNARAKSTETKSLKKSQPVERASTKSSALDSQAKATLTPSTSISPNHTKSSSNSSPTKTMKTSSNPKERETDSKPVLTKAITPKATHVRQPMNSKALSLAELKARKEAAKKSNKASSSSLPSYKSTSNASAPQTSLPVGADSDESESESDSESSSDDQKEKSSAAARKRKAFQKVVSRPDPTIRDRSISIDVGDDEESS